MEISVITGDALAQHTPLLVLGAYEDEALAPQIAALLEQSDWAGGLKRTLVLYPRGAVPARRVMLVGLGKRAQLTFERLCDAAAAAAQRARDLQVERYAVELPAAEQLSPAAVAQALAEGSQLGLYRFLHYRTGLSDGDRHEIAELAIVAREQDDAIRQGAALGQAIARGVALARDLANGPGNDITPARLGEAAQAIGQRTGATVTVLGLDELRAQGFGGILGVGQGSAQPPRFIIVEHGAKQPGVPTVCLVGKGITFDTGGISIKPADKMDEMKMDMSGAAAVLGAMQIVGELKLPLHVVGLVASAENMPSSTAYKPGDIIKTLSGKTIEVLNTDAEGRVVLADALFYAQRYQPDGIIDLATLTGAIVVALGTHATGIMSNDDALAERVIQAGETTGERVWRMPLWEPYKEMVKSDIADVKNSAGRPAGSLTAAAFLANFVGDYPWVHMDIAGTAWTDPQPKKAYTPKGATGVGVRLLIQALRAWSDAGH
ncbi:MAG: leucyl aminopeptidase [Kouleothrix sp.]|nr:leucyl aminopeptidase [Kouleothrix sp.]